MGVQNVRKISIFSRAAAVDAEKELLFEAVLQTEVLSPTSFALSMHLFLLSDVRVAVSLNKCQQLDHWTTPKCKESARPFLHDVSL